MSTEIPVPAPAVRARRPGWRDPRFLVGLTIMSVCVLIGSWLLATADTSVTVLALRHSLPAGATVSSKDVKSVQVHGDHDLLARYFSGTDDLAAGAALDRPIGAGELLPRSAVGHGPAPELLEVPLSVAVDDVPQTVTAGSVVDVWVVPEKANGASSARAELVLAQVRVRRLPASGASLAPQATRQVVVTLPAAGAAGRIATALGHTALGRVVLVRRS